MKNLLLVTTAAGAALAAILSSGCSRDVDAKNSSAPMKVEAAPDPNTVEADHPDRFPLASAEARHLRDDILVNGVVTPDVSRTVPVNALSGGRVIDTRARLGDDVRKGQVLLRLHSPDLASAIAEYQKALADETLARRAMERADLLFEHGALARKDLEIARDTDEKARVDVRSAAARIRLLGGSTTALDPIIDVTAPISGTITEQNTTAGAAAKSLDNSPNLFTIADLSRVWVVCDVYENNLAQVRLGDYAEVRLGAYPDRSLRGRVSNIGRILDPATRTAKVRLELPNPSGLLRPGMFATAKFTSQDSRTRIVVPASAVLRLHDRDWVFVPEGGTRYRRTEIQGGPNLPDGTQVVLAGLRPGDRLVANALQFSSAVEK
jgi:cobalt-zinc-cadmium efflux system membrane fusion protein